MVSSLNAWRIAWDVYSLLKPKKYMNLYICIYIYISGNVLGEGGSKKKKTRISSHNQGKKKKEVNQ